MQRIVIGFIVILISGFLMTCAGGGAGGLSMSGSVEVKAEAKWTLPECAPPEVATFSARVDKFSRGSEATLDLYNKAIADLAVVLGVDATPGAIAAYIRDSVQVSCSFKVVVEANTSFSGSAAVDNDEASMIASGSASASIRTEFSCDTATNPAFTGANLEKIRAHITNLKLIAELSHGLKLKSEAILGESWDQIVGMFTNVADCPPLIAQWNQMQAEFKTAVETAGSTWEKCATAKSGSLQVVDAFSAKFE